MRLTLEYDDIDEEQEGDIYVELDQLKDGKLLELEFKECYPSYILAESKWTKELSELYDNDNLSPSQCLLEEDEYKICLLENCLLLILKNPA